MLTLASALWVWREMQALSYAHAHIRSFSAPSPIEVVTEHRVQFPVLYDRSLLLSLLCAVV